MKKTLITLTIILLWFTGISQETTKKNSFNISFGYGLLYNDLNEDYYMLYKYQGYTDLYSLDNFSLKVEIPTKYNFLDLTFGATYTVDKLEYGDNLSWVVGSYGRSNEYLNGGSIYMGISPKLKFKYFGLTSEFCLGYYTYRQHLTLFDLTQNPTIDVHQVIETSGLGAQINAGVYFKIWRIGINPKISYVLSADSDASYLFYGFEVPLVLYF